jgi:hypothetical protein
MPLTQTKRVAAASRDPDHPSMVVRATSAYGGTLSGQLTGSAELLASLLVVLLIEFSLLLCVSILFLGSRFSTLPTTPSSRESICYNRMYYTPNLVISQ